MTHMATLSTLAFAILPLLIALDPAAAVSVYLSLTRRLGGRERLIVLRDTIITALVLGFAFMFLGALIFRALGIDENDFKIGGGLILLVLSLSDLVGSDRAERTMSTHVGIVPLGTPMIIGPAVLASLTILQNQHGNLLAGTAFLITISLLAAALAAGGLIARLMGEGGLAAMSKIVSILLAAFAVHLIRAGVTAIITS